MNFKITSLPAIKESINLFAKSYIESNYGDYDGLFHIINLWKTNLYSVYAIQSEGALIGLIHGWCRGDDYYGHIWFSNDYRGRVATEATLKVIDRVMEDFGIDKVCSVVPAENKKARLFLKNIGFTNEKDKFTLRKEDNHGTSN